MKCNINSCIKGLEARISAVWWRLSTGNTEEKTEDTGITGCPLNPNVVMN